MQQTTEYVLYSCCYNVHNILSIAWCIINLGSASLIRLGSIGGVSMLSVTINIILFIVVIVQCILISKRTTRGTKTGYQGGEFTLTTILVAHTPGMLLVRSRLQTISPN